jgi:hypothetical protein
LGFPTGRSFTSSTNAIKFSSTFNTAPSTSFLAPLLGNEEEEEAPTSTRRQQNIRRPKAACSVRRKLEASGCFVLTRFGWSKSVATLAKKKSLTTIGGAPVIGAFLSGARGVGSTPDSRQVAMRADPVKQVSSYFCFLFLCLSLFSYLVSDLKNGF